MHLVPSAVLAPVKTSQPAFMVLFCFCMISCAPQARADDVFVCVQFTNVWRYNDTGIDLGTAWQNPTFDDTMWPTGSGVLGYPPDEPLPPGSPPFQTVLNLLAPGTTNALTTDYFRTHFNFPSNPQPGTMLYLEALIDDGAVLYLNGAEFARYGMPTGVVSNQTLATRSVRLVADSGYDGGIIPATNLVAGDNVLAVEVHQWNSISSDVVFDLKLKAILPAAITITQQPLSRTSILASATGMSVGVSGTSPSFQWYKDGLAVSGAQSQSYAISNGQTNHAGAYYVVITNMFGGVTSAVATLTLVPDSSPPTLVSAIAGESTVLPLAKSNQVIVTFSERMDSVSSSVPVNYTITICGTTNNVIVTFALYGNAQVRLTANAGFDVGTRYILTVNNLRDFNSNAIPPNTQIDIIVGAHPPIALPHGQTWSYNDMGADPGTHWREKDYDDSWWPAAPAGFFGGYTNVIVPCLGFFQTPVSLHARTYYYRSHFNAFPNTGRGQLMLSYMMDDGAIFYLNGVEIYRDNMPAGPADFDTFALSQRLLPQCGGPVTIAATNLVSGDNVLAAEVHLSNPGPATSFSAQLDGTVTAASDGVTPPALRVVRQSSNIALSWTRPGAVLQSAPGPDGPWQPVTNGTYRCTALATNTAQFFRLHQ